MTQYVSTILEENTEEADNAKTFAYKYSVFINHEHGSWEVVCIAQAYCLGSSLKWTKMFLDVKTDLRIALYF